MKVLVTGGCGFIGSNFIKYLLTNSGIKDIKIINLDKQTYAGQGGNLENEGLDKDGRYLFIKGDICDKKLIEEIFSKENPEIIFNFAAESHVDRSIQGSQDFIMSNIVGAVNLLDFARKFKTQKFVQISTDETYGSIKEGSFSEQDKLNPSSPYSSSKAAAEMIALSYFKTHGLPVIITRSANNYGPYQFPEKVLPLFITNLIQGEKVPLMWSPENPGLNVRDWLHVEDNCRAIWLVSQNGKFGEVYNIPGENEKTNMEITKMLLGCFGFGEEMIQHVDHRKGHDFRYSIKGDKLKNLGFRHEHKDLNSEIKNLVEWYKQNKNWWLRLKNNLG
jgi:dTDP-glucose 4,6-dehydratase